MSSYGYNGPRGLSISELLLHGGEIEADAARRSGDMWGGIASNIGGLASKAITDYGEQKDAREVQHAVTAATTSQSVDPSTPNAGIESIINGVPPELRDKARAGIDAVRSTGLKAQEAYQKVQQQQREAQQTEADHWGTFGSALENHLADPDGGIQLASFGVNAFRGLPGAERLGPFAQGAAKAYSEAPDEASKQAVVVAWRNQVAPIIAQGKANMSLDAQKKWADTQKALADAKPAPSKTREVQVRNPDGSTTIQIVEDAPGQKFTSSAAPDTRSVEVQMAEAAEKGDTAKVQRLRGLLSSNAVATRDPNRGDQLVKVEHKDDATGRTVIEWLPKSQLAGKTFDKGTSATLQTRLASAEAVNQTGQDIIRSLSDPKIAAVVGPIMGKYNNLREFIGNPPPEFAELAGSIESYALASMGVHGMRSTQGAEKIKALMDGKHTPESIIAAINGLNKFSAHFMENNGMGQAPKAAAGGPPVVNSPEEARKLPSGTVFRTPDGRTLRVP